MKKIYFIFAIVLLTTSLAFGDTFFIEDFEGDVSNWTFGTSGEVDLWYCGTAVQHTGSKSAYISCDSGEFANYWYDEPSDSYLTTYIVLENPSAIYLSFYWKCMGGSQEYGEVYVNENRVSEFHEFHYQPNWMHKSNIDLTPFVNKSRENMVHLKFYWHNQGIDHHDQDPGFCVDDITITEEPVAHYVSSTVTQNSNNIFAGQMEQHTIGMEIVISDSFIPLSATQFALNTTGTTNTSDISNAKIFYTGTSSVFAATTQFGSTVASPGGSFNVNGTQALVEGTNYFWLTYDISAQATAGNYVDAQCTQITVEGVFETPTVTAPSGARRIRKIPEDFAGTALDFDGDNDQVATSGFAKGPNISIEFWVKFNSFPSGQFENLIGDGESGNDFCWMIYRVQGQQNIRTHIYTTNGYNLFDSATNILINEWSHICVTTDGANLRLYINGVEDANSPLGYTGTLVNTDNPLYIGKDGRGTPPPDAIIEEVRIWNVARTEQEIRENMHKTLAGAESDLVSYWQLNEGSGTTANDIIGGNNGTLYSMTSEDWVNSTVPNGGGISNSQIEANGTIDFTGTDLSMNFTSQSGAFITVTKIDNAPNNNPAGINTFDSQYWVVNRFGSGSFNTHLTFTVSEDLTTYDQSHPERIKLYERDSNAYGSWTQVTSASSVNAASNTATFDDIDSFSQFVVCKSGGGVPDDFPGNALDFDGVDDQVAIPSFEKGPNLSIEFWIKFKSFPTGQFDNLIGDGEGINDFYRMIYRTADQQKIRTHIKTTDGLYSFDSEIDLSTNEWSHICVTTDGTNLRLFINGVEDTNSPLGYTGTPVNTDNPIYIGKDGRGAPPPDAIIDEVRTWNVASTAQQIRENMHKTLSGTESGLMCYWQLNDGSGISAIDIVSGYDGTLIDMTSGDWVNSTVPNGGGISNSQTVSSPGSVTFTNTDLAMYFTAKSGTDDFTVTRIDHAPNTLPSVTHVLNDRYWVVNRFGSGTYNTNLTFTLPIGYLDPGDRQLKLYSRDSNSDGSWTGPVGTLGTLTETTVEFTGITSFSQFTIGSEGGSTLPVVLSSFNAQFLNNVPTLCWTTQSETNNIGWYIYRNIENDFTSAEKVSDLIDGYGTTSEPHDYTYMDTLEYAMPGDTFWYWLESVDLGGENHHYNNEVMLTVPDDYEQPVPPEIPIIYGLYQNCPNPFNPAFTQITKICFNLHKSVVVEISVYNIQGQLVKCIYNDYAEFDDSKPKPKVAYWNGRDKNGKIQANGIYFYIMKVDGKDKEIKKLILLR